MKAIDRLTELGDRLRRRPASFDAERPTVVIADVTAGAGVPPAVGIGGSTARIGAAWTGAAWAGATGPGTDPREEAALWERLREDPNDVEAFPRLAEIVRANATAGHEAEGRSEDDRRRAADDAVWALAEELAHNSRAWFPLIELGRLSVHTDRESALRRLATAAERDPSGRALATALAVLREEQLPSDALGLGVAHWRPSEHDLEAGRHLVLAAIEARRIGDARRHLDALSTHPDAGRVAELRRELDGLISQLEAERVAGGPMTDPAGISVRGPLIDLRDSAIARDRHKH